MQNTSQSGEATSRAPRRPCRTRGDRVTKVQAYSDRDGAVVSCYVPASEWPEWTDCVSFTVVGKGA